MKLTLLGSGAVGGVPLYGCDCPACVRARAMSDYILSLIHISEPTRPY